MSLRRPTVAYLLFTFVIGPVCDAAQTSNGGIPVIYIFCKPCLRCCSDVRLWHFFYSPLCDVAQTSDCGIYFTALYVMSLRRPTVAFLLKPFMRCRSDVRLWHFF